MSAMTLEAEMAANITIARERVALNLGPQAGDEAAYWAELVEWQDWTPWLNPEPQPEVIPDWRQT